MGSLERLGRCEQCKKKEREKSYLTQASQKTSMSIYNLKILPNPERGTLEEDRKAGPVTVHSDRVYSTTSGAQGKQMAILWLMVSLSGLQSGLPEVSIDAVSLLEPVVRILTA